MATKRTERLARAIENLSARDMAALVNFILQGYTDGNKYVITMMILRYAEHSLPKKEPTP